MLFLPLLLYKRRWKEAIWMLVFLVGLNLLLPAMRLGMPLTWKANRLFFAKSLEVASAMREDPTANGVEDPKHTNKSLRMAIARYLQTYPPGHPLFISRSRNMQTDGIVAPDTKAHPLFVQFLDLPPRTAGRVVTAILLPLVLSLAVWYRHPWIRGNLREGFATEWAIAVALCALLSPLCWGQHMVLFIPAVFLSMQAELAGNSRLRTVGMWAAGVLILGNQRELIGRDLWWILQSYKLETIGALIIITLTLTIRKSRIPLPGRQADMDDPNGTRGTLGDDARVSREGSSRPS